MDRIALNDTEATPSLDIIGTIRDCYSALRPAEQAVADVILSDVRSAVHISNADIAESAGVSQPTVTRFCRAVGCEGVRDLKIQLAQSLVVGETFLQSTSPDAPQGDLPPFWNSVMSEAQQALREVERQLSAENVMIAATALAGAGRVATFGLGGSSATLALEMQVRLFRYGVAVDACRDPYVARMTASTLKPGDAFLAVSSTGRTREVVDALTVAKQYGARTLAITQPDSIVADAADIPLTVAINEYPDVLTPSASRFAFLGIVDLVAAATGYHLGSSARENLRRIKFNLIDSQQGDNLDPLGD